MISNPAWTQWCRKSGSYIPASRLFFPDGLRPLRLSCGVVSDDTGSSFTDSHLHTPLQAVCPAAPRAGRLSWGSAAAPWPRSHRHQAAAAGSTGSTGSPGRSERTVCNTRDLPLFHLPAAATHCFCRRPSSFISTCRFINPFISANLLEIFSNNSCP